MFKSEERYKSGETDKFSKSDIPVETDRFNETDKSSETDKFDLW